MNIFEQLNMLLNESKTSPKATESDIPIHPEMETEEQGKMAAYEKFLKLFQKLSMGSGGTESIKDGRPDIPDDMIDPMFKEPPKSVKDKTFEKNKLAGWDEESDEKFEKEIETETEDEDDEFDDFDYRRNEFGDEDDRSEDEKLKDAIDDAIDSLSEDDGGESGGEDDDDSGANWDDDDKEGYPGGYPSGGEPSGGEPKVGEPSGGEPSGGEPKVGEPSGGEPSGGEPKVGEPSGGEPSGGEPKVGEPSGGEPKVGEPKVGEPSGGEPKVGEPSGGEPSGGEPSGGEPISGKGRREGKSAKQKRLEDLKKALDSKGMEGFDEKIGEIKSATDTPEDEMTPGAQIETPSDESFKEEMSKAGFDDKTIDKMSKKKNIDGNEDYSEGELDKLRKEVVDGLERSCKEKGGSALASTIVKHALKHKLTNVEWKEMLKMFLKTKSIGVGSMSSSNKGIGFGHKNHVWRDAILPHTHAPSEGTIQTIYCFVDFSGSVKETLVYNFLSKVIDLCVELKYTKVKVYGFGEVLTEPRVLDKRALKNGTDVALSQTWDFIVSQKPGWGTENFSAVTKEINAIKRKERDAVCLIFGDGYWQDPELGPKCLKYEIMNNKYLDDICVLAYFQSERDRDFAGVMNILKEIVGIKHIITTKTESLQTKK